MKRIYLALIVLLCVLSAYSQQSALLEKYRFMALDYNHDLKAAEKNISAGIELEKAAKADLKPKLSGDADFQYVGRPIELNMNLPGMDQPMTIQGRDTKYGASVTLLQPIYTGGRLVETIHQAELQTSLDRNQKEKLQADICFQTDLQYWNTVAQLEIVTVIQDFRNSIASLVKTIRERVEVQLVNPQDLLMAEVKLNDAEFQLLQAQKEFETGRMALNSVIGVELDAPTEIETSIPSVTLTDNMDFPGNLRPEIKMRHNQINLAESSRKLTDSKYKPQLYLGVDGNYTAPGYDFRSDLDPNYAVYAKLSVPLFEWGKRKKEKRAANLRTDMAKDYLNQTKDYVNLEIQTARTSLTQALNQVELSRKSLDKAQENELKATERYTEGNISIVEVIEAQTYRQTAQVNHVQAKTAAQGQYSALIKALNLYDFQ